MRASLLLSLSLSVSFSLVACAPTTRTGSDAASPLDSGSEATTDSGTPDAGSTDAGTTHDATIGADGGTCGGSLMQSGSCESSLESMCCTEMTTCNATTGCPAVFECLHACTGDGTCFMDCLMSATSGVGESSAVDGCLYMHCPPSCRAM